MTKQDKNAGQLKVARQKLGVLELAQALGDVKEACGSEVSGERLSASRRNALKKLDWEC